MIRELRLQNFKCFADTTLTFAPLTLLAGANAAGKSTTIQSLLLLRQSHLRGALGRGELLLNGTLASVGTARDVLNQAGTSGAISFEIADSAGRIGHFPFRFDREQRDSYVLNADGRPRYETEINLFTPQFNYLNAERIGPRLLYPMAELRGDSIDVGVHGEYAAHVLARYRDELIICTDLALRNEEAGEVSRTVEAQTRYWMRTFIPDFDIQIDELTAADQVQVMLRTGSREFVRPTNIGFGIIYTLPIVVAALVAPAGSLLIVENPEAHLHPASQSKIGMFLARAAAAGIQVIIETHSDHVLNGIRRSVRSAILSPQQVSIIFFSGAGQIEQPQIYIDGGIDPWPDGFFDQIEKDLRELF
jgi:predicted ATPase